MREPVDAARPALRATAASAAWAASIGNGRRAVGTARPRGRAASVGAISAVRGDARQHAVAGARGRPRRTRSGRRVSGDCGSATSRAASAERQALRLLAEIGERGGAHALEIAAIGREREVEVEDLGLARAAARAAPRARIWRELGGERALLARLEQARHLHGQRRAAGDDAAAAHAPARRRAAAPADRRRDGVMKRLVLDRPCSMARKRGSTSPGVTGSRQRPSAVVKAPQQPAVAVEHDGRALREAREVERAEPVGEAPQRRPPTAVRATTTTPAAAARQPAPLEPRLRRAMHALTAVPSTSTVP